MFYLIGFLFDYDFTFKWKMKKEQKMFIRSGVEKNQCHI